MNTLISKVIIRYIMNHFLTNYKKSIIRLFKDRVLCNDASSPLLFYIVQTIHTTLEYCSLEATCCTLSPNKKSEAIV